MLYIAHIEKKEGRVYILFLSEKEIKEDYTFNATFEKENISNDMIAGLKHYDRLGYIDHIYASFNPSELKQSAKFKLKYNNKKIKYLQGNRYSILIKSIVLFKENKLYIYPTNKNELIFCNKFYFYLKAIQKKYIYLAWISCLFKQNKVLFSEYASQNNDNSFQIFDNLSKNHTKHARFITRNKTGKKFIKINSLTHIFLLLRAKKIITSWNLHDGALAVSTRKLGYLYPFFKFKWIFVPHGISFDKESYFLSKYCFCEPNLTLCCSQMEKDYLKKMGYNNIQVSGYPRMDKWKTSNLEKDKTILISFSYNRHLSLKEHFEISAYWKLIQDLIFSLSDYHITYCFHHAVTPKIKNYMINNLSKNNNSIEFISQKDQAKFNQAIIESNYLITDTSSVAYDFSYMRKMAIFYIHKDIPVNYKFLDTFWDNNTGHIAKNLTEVIDTIKNESVDNNRINNFFKYIDNKNTERAIDLIYNQDNY